MEERGVGVEQGMRRFRCLYSLTFSHPFSPFHMWTVHFISLIKKKKIDDDQKNGREGGFGLA